MKSTTERANTRARADSGNSITPPERRRMKELVYASWQHGRFIYLFASFDIGFFLCQAAFSFLVCMHGMERAQIGRFGGDGSFTQVTTGGSAYHIERYQHLRRRRRPRPISTSFVLFCFGFVFFLEIHSRRNKIPIQRTFPNF